MGNFDKKEDHYFDLGKLHIVFCVVALVFLGVTIAVLVVDHRRPWKNFQRQYREEIRPWLEAIAAFDSQVNREGEKADVDLKFQPPKGMPVWIKWLFGGPFLEPFTRQVRVEQIRVEGAPLDFHFSLVPRIDRCITCHQGMSPVEAAAQMPVDCLPERTVILWFPPFDTEESGDGGSKHLCEQSPSAEARVTCGLGLYLAEGWPLGGTPVVVVGVKKHGLAARAGFLPGDRILAVGDHSPKTVAEACEAIFQSLKRGTGVRVTLRRGLPHPFAAHPQPGLYVSPASPHPVEKFGCSVCHQGNGGATSFSFAGHVTTEPSKQERWETQLGWREEKDWPWPMRARPFIEASCTQCHHDPAEFATATTLGAVAAPRLVEGYRLAMRLGCFGCHEIRGRDLSGMTKGPNLAVERLTYEAAGALADLPTLPGDLRQLALEYRLRPWEDSLRLELLHRWREWQARYQAGVGQEAGSSPTLPGEAGDRLQSRQLDHAGRISFRGSVFLENLLAEAGEGEGQMPKVGPSLRHVASKLSRGFVTAYLWDPQDYFPAARMPRFFGLYDHLSEEEKNRTYELEKAEIWAIASYLVPQSPAVSASGGSAQPAGVDTHGKAAGGIGCSEEASPADEASTSSLLKGDPQRGAILFRRQGCVACHSHGAFPDATADFGPDLTHLAHKLHPETGRKWLREWIEDPARYSPRTAMPKVLFQLASEVAGGTSELEQLDQDPGAGVVPRGASVEGLLADLEAFLLEPSDRDLKPLAEPSQEAIDELARLYLAEMVGPVKANQIVRQEGSSEEISGFGTMAWELLGPLTLEAKLRFVARQSLRHRGCTGCHEIPGLEGEPPIGPPLTGWGDKSVELLDFGERALRPKIVKGFESELPGSDYRQRRPGGKEFSTSSGNRGEMASRSPQGSSEGGLPVGGDQFRQADDSVNSPINSGHCVDPAELAAIEEWLRQAFLAGRREGFLWQKLSRPRSFDLGRTRTKPYPHWLRMPQFRLSEEERLALMTFVLGLSRQPVSREVLPTGGEDGRLYYEGIRLVERLGCAQCHVLDWERWWVRYDPQLVEVSPAEEDFAFLKPRLAESGHSNTNDRSGLFVAQLWGAMERGPDGLPLLEEGDRGLQYFFNLWEAVAFRVGGKKTFWEPGGPQVVVEDPFGLARAVGSGPADSSLFAPPHWRGKGPEVLPMLDVVGTQVQFPALTVSSVLREGQADRPFEFPPPDRGTPGADPSGQVFGAWSWPSELPQLLGLRPSVGGYLAFLLLPEIAGEIPGTPMEAWSLLPPPLVRQGDMTKREWLRDYLRNPFPIRPSTILRMPQYHLSPKEAEVLATYFEEDGKKRQKYLGIWYPPAKLTLEGALEQGGEAGIRRKISAAGPGLSSNSRPQDPEHKLAEGAADPRQPGDLRRLPAKDLKFLRRQQAFKVLLDRTTFCGKCHLLGDYSPSETSALALGPRLDQVAGRFQEDYLRRWLANPRKLLPYTGMPVNFPPTGPPLGQDLLPGTSQEQIEAVVDLLLNFPDFIRDGMKVSDPQNTLQVEIFGEGGKQP